MSDKPVATLDDVFAAMLRNHIKWGTPTVSYNFSGFSSAQKAAAVAALQYYSDVIPLHFSEGSGGISFSNAALGGSVWGTTSWNYNSQVNGYYIFSSASTQVNTGASGVNASYSLGGFDVKALTHEIGHALGLAHPGTYDGGSGGYDRDGAFFQDSEQYTVMSYFDASNTGGDHNGHFASTPLLLDIASLQHLYGANTTTRTGDTTYGFNSNAGRDALDFTIDKNPIVAIWDAGGNDTIDLSGYKTDSVLNLNAGEFSDVAGMEGNLAIAYGATIENGIGGSGDDTFIANAVANSLSGGDGDDTFEFGVNFTGADSVFGGKGIDELSLEGNYAKGTAFGANSMTGVETIRVAAGFNYNLTLNDANVAAGETLRVVATELGRKNGLTFDGSHETDGVLELIGGKGGDKMTGGAGNDIINGLGGKDVLSGGDGDDAISVGGAGVATLNGGLGDDKFGLGDDLTAQDTIVGGSGEDTLVLIGNYKVAFSATTISNVEQINLGAGHSYDLTFNDANVSAHDVLAVDGHGLNIHNTLLLDGSRETDGSFDFRGGDGTDTLIGGRQADIINGGAGADSLNGGLGKDIFVYDHAAESTGSRYDTIIGFDAASDSLDISGAIRGIDAEIEHGSLSTATFAGNMQALNKGHLLAHDAIMVTPDDGTLAGQHFLVVDMNGQAGFQSGKDLVIHLDSATNLADLGTTDFI